MNKSHFLTMVFMAATLLTACNGSQVEKIQPLERISTENRTQEIVQEANLAPIQSSEIVGEQGQLAWPDGQTQEDNQGQVTFEVKPLNLNDYGTTLNFDVVMNTHSVDLSMDLAQLATMRTDTGLIADAISWEAPEGGHHVSGLLKFPTVVDGTELLENAAGLTLTIENVDAPERIFTWQPSE